MLLVLVRVSESTAFKYVRMYSMTYVATTENRRHNFLRLLSSSCMG
jgi:hypothetical protein